MQPRFLCTSLNPLVWLSASQLYFSVFSPPLGYLHNESQTVLDPIWKENNNNSCDFLQSETINQENNGPIFPVITITSDRALSPQRKTNDDLQ